MSSSHKIILSCLKAAFIVPAPKKSVCLVLVTTTLWLSPLSWWSALRNLFSSISLITSLQAWNPHQYALEPADPKRMPYQLPFTQSPCTWRINTVISGCCLLTSAQHSTQSHLLSWLENLTLWAWVQKSVTGYGLKSTTQSSIDQQSHLLYISSQHLPYIVLLVLSSLSSLCSATSECNLAWHSAQSIHEADWKAQHSKHKTKHIFISRSQTIQISIHTSSMLVLYTLRGCLLSPSC